MLPEGLHETTVTKHHHRYANTRTGLVWIWLRRWTSPMPRTRDMLIEKLAYLLPTVWRAECNTCGWHGECRYIGRMAENDMVDHAMGTEARGVWATVDEGLTSLREEIRRTFTNPQGYWAEKPVTGPRYLED